MMSRKIYMQELEQEARRKAREARLAFATAAGGSKDDAADVANKPQSIENELMELVEQGREIIGKIWVIRCFPRAQQITDDQ